MQRVPAVVGVAAPYGCASASGRCHVTRTGARMLPLCAPLTAALLALGKGTAARGSLRRRGGRCGRRVDRCGSVPGIVTCSCAR